MKNLLLFSITMLLGLSHLSAQTFFNYYENDLGNYYQQLAIDHSNNRIWVGTNQTTTGQSLAFFENGAWTVVNVDDNNLASGQIRDMIIDDGVLYYCTWGGYSKVDYGNASYDFWNSTNSGLSADAVNCLTMDETNNLLYIGQANGFDMLAYNGTDWGELDNVRQALDVEIDFSSGVVWVSSKFYGLYKIDAGVISNYTSSDFAPLGDEVRSLEIDAQGTIWFSLENAGIASFDGTNWTPYNSANDGLLDDEIRDLHIAPDGRLWLAYKDGLSVLDNGVFTHYDFSDYNFNETNVRDIEVADDGTVWFVGYNGLSKLSFETSPVYLIENPILDEIYPNPASEFIVVNSNEEIEMSFYDPLGRLLKTQCIKPGEHQLDISGWQAGVIFYSLQTDKGVFPNKFIKK